MWATGSTGRRGDRQGQLGSAAVPAPLLERAATSSACARWTSATRCPAGPIRWSRRGAGTSSATLESDFAATGDEFLGHFTRLGGLEPGHRVLDIGCGIGRMARPLTRFLAPDAGGRYDGFDVNPEGIAWCRDHYGSETHPAFSFVVADLFNARYTPTGTRPRATFSFPYADGSFDFTLADLGVHAPARG